MNRQIRRATKKAETKQERDKLKLKDARREKRQAMVTRARERRAAPPKESRQGTPSVTPGRQRFTGALALFTAVVIALQAVAPAPDQPTFELVIRVLYFMILGYFLNLWLERQNVSRAFPFTIATAGILVVAVEAVRFIRTDVTGEPLLVLAAVPLAALGAYFARFVSSRTQNA